MNANSFETEKKIPSNASLNYGSLLTWRCASCSSISLFDAIFCFAFALAPTSFSVGHSSSLFSAFSLPLHCVFRFVFFYCSVRVLIVSHRTLLDILRSFVPCRWQNEKKRNNKWFRVLFKMCRKYVRFCKNKPKSAMISFCKRNSFRWIWRNEYVCLKFNCVCACVCVFLSLFD